MHLNCMLACSGSLNVCFHAPRPVHAQTPILSPQAPKPPSAHHCAVCKACVVDQDHHCPFVNNCVGRANLRNFLHFTGWVCAAMVFCIAHCALAMVYRYRCGCTALGAAVQEVQYSCCTASGRCGLYCQHVPLEAGLYCTDMGAVALIGGMLPCCFH